MFTTSLSTQICRSRACKGEANFRNTLIAAFPHERSNIEQYFRDLRSATSWANRYIMAMAMPPLLARMIRAVNRFTAGLPLEVTQQYLERRFGDPELRAVVTSQWADYGLPPGLSAFATHAVIASHYLNGAWYPDGGAGQIAKETGSVIRAAGGELLPNHEVTRILLEGSRAVGVEVNIRKGKQGLVRNFERRLSYPTRGRGIPLRACCRNPLCRSVTS
jgi:all-trans-retinol 13,14-reductase